MLAVIGVDAALVIVGTVSFASKLVWQVGDNVNKIISSNVAVKIHAACATVLT